ncbi:hypothetical protein BH18ACT12_BH18ACT12_01040 [soil metagenome]
MRRLLYACALTLLAMPQFAAAKSATSWAQAELKAVVAAGLMAREAAARPNDPLTRGQLETIAAGISHLDPVVPATPDAPVTMTALDSRLVSALGLTNAAKLFRQGAKDAGLAPPARFGTEAVARLLGLRTNHPAGQDRLELSPTEPATRAEAAYSTARILRFGEWDPVGLQGLAGSFVFPALTPWQTRVLKTAMKLIGYPYVWGGESESTASPFGPQAHGGFDCSGFVWRVYKVQRYANAGTLADTLRDRTTYGMSGEVPAGRRISLAKLQPADVIFFGKGPKSRPAQVDHLGLYLGNAWFIHSSRYGVALEPLTGWYAKRFAWGRRPLAEAGLVSAS